MISFASFQGNSQGIDRVLKEDGMYAFFMEAAAIEYHVERKCDLKQLGKNYFGS